MFAILTRLFARRRPVRPTDCPTYPPLIAWDDWSTPPPPVGSTRPYDPRSAAGTGVDAVAPGAGRGLVLMGV